jgi:predicted dienelactone hydrolase
MLGSWDGHNHIDPARIGMLGHSAGGATVLIAVGGNPDFDLSAPFCRDHPDAWDCQRVKARSGPAPAPTEGADRKPLELHHDPRIRAAAIAAPAIGYVFTKHRLAAVTVPVQLWGAENDRITPNQWNADVVEAALPTPPEDHLVPLAGHFDFLAPCSAALAERAPEICRDPPAFDRTDFHRDFNAAVVAFFRKQLDGR